MDNTLYHLPPPEQIVITTPLLQAIRAQYRLRWLGTHGIEHWHRVFVNGLRLAEQDGVNSRVVQLFAVFHDACRRNEHRDRGHGRRGAALACRLRRLLPLDDGEFSLLVTACCLHTSTLDHEDITVQACFDADRLDLGRVGIHPHPSRLCTPLAREPDTIEWGWWRSRSEGLPERPFGLEPCQEGT